MHCFVSGLGFGLILMIPAMRTTKRSLASQSNCSCRAHQHGKSRLQNQNVASWSAKSNFIPNKSQKWISCHLLWIAMIDSQTIIPLENRLGLHEEIAVDFGFSSKLHQLCSGVSILLVVPDSSRLGNCFSPGPGAENFKKKWNHLVT